MPLTNFEQEFQHKLHNNQNFLNILPPNNIIVEAWLGNCNEPIVTTLIDDVIIKSNSQGLYGSMTVPSYLSNEMIEKVIHESYLRIFKALEMYPDVKTVRFWNYMPNITGIVDGSVTRYQLFNAGRYNAFKAYYGEKLKSMAVPAASTVGTDENQLKIEFLALKSPATMIENREQIPAYDYSKNYGKIPPFFSRAVIFENASQNILLSSGTASIVGENSKYLNSLEEQLTQSIQNLRILGSASNLQKHQIDGNFELENIDFLRVYYKNSDDRPLIERMISESFSTKCKVTFQHADICREELLVEIEGLYVKGKR